MPISRGNMARIFLPLILLISGCASAPPPRPTPTPQASGVARLILFRPYNLIAMGGDALLTVNGKASCDLPNGTGYVKDVAPGDVTITAAIQNPSVFQTDLTKLKFTVSAGQSYYLKVSPSGESFGAIGTLEVMASGGSGPFNIDEGSKFDLGKIVPSGCPL